VVARVDAMPALPQPSRPDTDSSPDAPAGAVGSQAVNPEAVMRTCPNCSAALEERKCKLLCTRCGYYMSCADYY
jgi:hypothetical protein